MLAYYICIHIYIYIYTCIRQVALGQVAPPNSSSAASTQFRPRTSIGRPTLYTDSTSMFSIVSIITINSSSSSSSSRGWCIETCVSIQFQSQSQK